MVQTVVIAGAGQLGSRYLQGLVNVDKPLDVIAIDKNGFALETSAERWIEAGGPDSHHHLRLETSSDAVPTSVDLVIVATTSQGRLDVIKQLIHRTSVQYWILEKLVTNDPAELPLFLECTSHSDSAWVNLPYRIMGWHQAIKRQLVGRGPCRVNLDGTNYGLLTNVIHYLDLIGWWMDTSIIDVTFASDTEGFFWSKRTGYIESNGIFHASFADGTVVTMRCRSEPYVEYSGVGLTFDISSPGGEWHVDERLGIMSDSAGHETHGRIELQSEMTASVVSQVLDGADCGLPHLSEVVLLHQKILSAIQGQWQASPLSEAKLVPVT